MGGDVTRSNQESILGTFYFKLLIHNHEMANRIPFLLRFCLTE